MHFSRSANLRLTSTRPGVHISNRRKSSTKRALLVESLEARSMLAAGFRDLTFGTNGIVTTDFFGQDDVANDVAVQPDGKIILAGTATVGLHEDFALVRYHPNGTVDTSFGTDGKVVLDFDDRSFRGIPRTSNDQAHALAIQPDGKIVVVGSSDAENNSRAVALARFNVDGSLDDGTASDSTPNDVFGVNGKVITNGFHPSEDGVTAYDVAIQPDGKIVAVGSLDNPAQYLVVVRYHSDGSVDESFDSENRIVGSSERRIRGNSVVIQNDGRITITGPRDDFASFSLARTTSDGSLDLDLGASCGCVRFSIPNHRSFAFASAIQPDGRIIMAGTAENFDTNAAFLALARRHADGSPDTSFGNDGSIVTQMGGTVTDIVLQPDGKFIIVNSSNFWVRVARFLPNGELDPAFSFDGQAVTHLTRVASSDLEPSLALQPDGRILVGTSIEASDGIEVHSDFGLARYLGDVEGTKFFVADRSADNTFKYDEQGDVVGGDDLAPRNTRPLGVSSSADGSNIWMIDQNHDVYVYAGDGTPLGSWTAKGLDSPQGVATDGTDVWIVDGGANKVFRYRNQASSRSGSHDPTSEFSLVHRNDNAKGITTDGFSIWVVNDTNVLDKVYKYGLDGTVMGSWIIDSANPRPTGLAIDPNKVDHMWIVDKEARRIFQYNLGASFASGSRTANATFELHPANTNPQGIADPSGRLISEDETASVASPTMRLDVNGDGTVSPKDALLVIQHVNERRAVAATSLYDMEPVTTSPNPFDVNGDGTVSARDVLLVIHDINRKRRNLLSVASPTAIASAIESLTHDDQSAHGRRRREMSRETGASVLSHPADLRQEVDDGTSSS